MTKNISLADDAYEALLAIKREDESFSDLARRASRQLRRDRILDLEGAWGDLGDDAAEALLASVYAARDETMGPRT